MINITDYENYFTALGAAHKTVSQTEKLDLYDVQSTIDAIRDITTDVLLLIETYAVRKSAASADQVHDIPSGAILILQGFDDPRGDKQQIKSDILANTERIANDFEARMKYDMEQENTFMADLDLNSISREKIGPDLGGRYGWRIQFRLRTFNPMILIPSMWNDL